MRKKIPWLPIVLVLFLFLFAQHRVNAQGQNPENIFDYVSSPTVFRINDIFPIKCVFSPSVNPINVTFHAYHPNTNSSHQSMSEMGSNKYITFTSFSNPGKYSFFISAEVNNVTFLSMSRYFWISFSINDKDNDKMDDSWEIFYGFDPDDPSDAYVDSDNDGYKNLDEYTMKTDPLDADYFEFVFLYINSHMNDIFLTLFFILIALLCSLYGLRRSTRWI